MISSREQLGSVPDEYKQLRYGFTAGPVSVDAVREAEVVNCQALVHRFYYEQFGVQLPLGMWSKEILEDTSVIFRDVSLESESLRYGDIVAFKPKKIPDEFLDDPNKTVHLTMYVGQNEAGEQTFLHANSTDEGVSLWRLDEFRDRYEEVKGVKRLQEDLHQIFIQPIIQD